MPIDDTSMQLDDDLQIALVEAIHRIRLRIRWRPGKDMQHLVKRIRFGHLAAGTTVVQYEAIIAAIIHDNQAKVYLFQYNNTLYPTLISTIQGQKWRVMIGMDGIMETAFPPSDPDSYLSDSAYHYVTVLEELLK